MQDVRGLQQHAVQLHAGVTVQRAVSLITHNQSILFILYLKILDRDLICDSQQQLFEFSRSRDEIIVT